MSFSQGAKAYVADRAAVRSEAALRAYLALLTQLGYYSIDWSREEGRIDEFLRAMNPGEPHFAPGVSPRLDEAVRELAAGTLPSVDLLGSFGPYDPSKDVDDTFDPEAFEIGIFVTQVDPTLGHVTLQRDCAGCVERRSNLAGTDCSCALERGCAAKSRRYAGASFLGTAGVAAR